MGAKLRSWAEIAEFIKCDGASARRYAAEMGLPVHQEREGGEVWTQVDELLSWVRSVNAPNRLERSNVLAARKNGARKRPHEQKQATARAGQAAQSRQTYKPGEARVLRVSARLRSWSEIAAFISCGVRTAQRYERELGLPVHREREGGEVWADTDALLNWVRGFKAPNRIQPGKHVNDIPARTGGRK